MSLQERIDEINAQINQIDEKRAHLLDVVKKLMRSQEIIGLALEDDTREAMKVEISRVERMTPSERKKEREIKKKFDFII